MVSPWKNSLPLEAYKADQVVICAYEDRWVPITITGLAEAIKLYRRALLHGTEIFVFPPDLSPWNSLAFNYQNALEEIQQKRRQEPAKTA
ncbi:MAG TPA: hypothetical protein V6D50_08980 [Chroococcales cyanobacterium]